MLNKKLFAFLLISAMLTPGLSKAQDMGGGDDVDSIESEVNRSAPKRQTIENSAAAKNYAGDDEKNVTDFKGLANLAPFQEISIIQKRFMPKTGRFELFGGGTIVTNDPFFNTMGGVLKAGYFLNESWGVELNYFGLTTAQRESTRELESNNGVSTESLAYPKSYIGADIMWSPIYGKMTWFNNRIIPFDLYFSGGYGMTETSTGESSGTIHVAAGQIFSLTKSVAFRWDFSWNFYNANVTIKEKDGSGNVIGSHKSNNSFNNLFLTVGVSWFFPEATYR
ncbi:outer membrane beta-barrel domain-containing protein [Bdellovibrio sp. HCB185ZH]|uniref:outer membrane beta-barrel domain-containing protein n=1 Tax=Bdellovibrio sp. HCB185ZH TaxID=3394235 RepID=UPI0039A4CE4B